ncbi:AAA family ATPase [Rothia mucilaginosa]|uniref:AAA family ATPase n=1 Tax=Rothia mucilaginosa TaxID=43675 RepID=UPI0026EDDF54|nr:AAA family ATPase [Rothia mucilaginosa]
MVDATKVSSIKIKTEYTGEREYPIFTRPDGKTAQCAIILGGNGSGKSTLARALSTETGKTKFLNKEEEDLGSDFSNVHVFNEEYVIKNFRASPEDSLDPVVMLGYSVVVNDYINELKNSISLINAKIESLKNQYLSDVISDELANVDIPHLDFTLKDYVKALLENEFLIEEELLFYNDESGGGSRIYLYDFIDDNMLDGKSISKEEYARCIASGFQRRFIDICKEIDQNASNGYSVTFIKNKIYKANKSLRENRDSIGRGVDGDAIIEAYEGVEDNWRKLSYWVMFLVYKEYNSVFQKISSRIMSSEDRELFKEYKRKIVGLEGNLLAQERKLEEINRKNSTGPVIDYINRLLGIVLGKEAMQVKPAKNHGYYVKNGQELVKPSRLSVGEQNILSLCYFFATLAQGKNFTAHIQRNLEFSLMENQIVVLDDPVSSFDDSNKYGVTSLLGYLCQSVLSKASRTKLIIMTHDLSFAANMEKMIKAIDDSKLSCLELQKDSSDVLIKSKFKDIDRYADMLGIMYDFAVSSQKSAVVPAPNDVRRVWEAFLMFELGETSIANMDSLKKMSGCFSKNQKIERFMRVFIPQLFINNDSHAKSQVMNGNLYLTPTLEGKPYEDFVKNIVCFMHLVSPRHIAWRMKKTQEENVHESVAKLDNLVREVLDDPKIVAATSSWQGIQGLRRARHRGGRVPLSLRQ